eukprot:1153553-Pelagomonas_calceolata.AAC.9
MMLDVHFTFQRAGKAREASQRRGYQVRKRQKHGFYSEPTVHTCTTHVKHPDTTPTQDKAATTPNKLLLTCGSAWKYLQMGAWQAQKRRVRRMAMMKDTEQASKRQASAHGKALEEAATAAALQTEARTCAHTSTHKHTRIHTHDHSPVLQQLPQRALNAYVYKVQHAQACSIHGLQGQRQNDSRLVGKNVAME